MFSIKHLQMSSISLANWMCEFFGVPIEESTIDDLIPGLDCLLSAGTNLDVEYSDVEYGTRIFLTKKYSNLTEEKIVKVISVVISVVKKERSLSQSSSLPDTRGRSPVSGTFTFRPKISQEIVCTPVNTNGAQFADASSVTGKFISSTVKTKKSPQKKFTFVEDDIESDDDYRSTAMSPFSINNFDDPSGGKK